MLTTIFLAVWPNLSITLDYGLSFTSQELKDFGRYSGIRHFTTVIYKPSTNGSEEKIMLTLKEAFITSSAPRQLSVGILIFNYWLTPHSTTEVSLTGLIFSRCL